MLTANLKDTLELNVKEDGRQIYPDPSSGHMPDDHRVEIEKGIFGEFVYGINSSETLHGPDKVYGFSIPKISPKDKSTSALVCIGM